MQYLLSKGTQPSGAIPTPMFNLNAPFATTPTPPTETPDVQQALASGEYPDWLALYLGAGDKEKGHAILQEAIKPSA